MVVGTRAREAHQVVGGSIPAREVPDVGEDFLLGDARRQIERLGETDLGRDLLEQLVDRCNADRREHLANILVGVGREVHERQSTAVPRTDPSST